MVGTKPHTVFDMPQDKLLDSRLDAIADAEIKAGKGVPHAVVREWLLKMIKGKKAPPPIH